MRLGFLGFGFEIGPALSFAGPPIWHSARNAAGVVEIAAQQVTCAGALHDAERSLYYSFVLLDL